MINGQYLISLYKSELRDVELDWFEIELCLK